MADLCVYWIIVSHLFSASTWSLCHVSPVYIMGHSAMSAICVHWVTVSLSHCFTVSLCHCVTVSLSHWVTVSLCHCVTVSDLCVHWSSYQLVWYVHHGLDWGGGKYRLIMAHCTIITSHITLHIVNSTLETSHFTIDTFPLKLHILFPLQHIWLHTSDNSHCTLHIPHYSMIIQCHKTLLQYLHSTMSVILLLTDGGILLL